MDSVSFVRMHPADRGRYCHGCGWHLCRCGQEIYSMPSERRNLTEPGDWWAAFERQAEADGQTLSEWAGDCMRANLPKNAAAELSDRPPANRPKKPKDEGR